MTLGELGERMSGQEFDLWLAYHREAPLGVERADLHAGVVASTVANFAGKQIKDGHSMKPADFMPGRRRDPDPEPDPLEHFGAM
jgi:hypothetical protein